ncbi:hypothetical protein FM038_26030 [Shewanella eurypsychrophilus]|uniref:Uncharacterized protein n=1 Tax=Shewanella eurypsychrophilus TaxID=2593656 RepID=A0ABX8S6W4_9GAMM|nr:hypothetical protein [Shewanella eurypsychrophilus]QXP45019.1 hypothetical protein FM038_26030 [Shewanella eurypsychrophilus]
MKSCSLALPTGVDAAVTVGGMDAAVEAIGIYLRRVTEVTAHTPLEAINISNVMHY